MQTIIPLIFKTGHYKEKVVGFTANFGRGKNGKLHLKNFPCLSFCYEIYLKRWENEAHVKKNFRVN